MPDLVVGANDFGYAGNGEMMEDAERKLRELSDV
jgi:hypothetical protein